MAKVVIKLPQNRYNETGIFGGDLSRAWYEALRQVMKLNPDASFECPTLSVTEQVAKKNGVKYDFEHIRKSVGRPW